MGNCSCFGSSHSAQQPTLNIQPSSQPSAVKGPEKYLPGLLYTYAHRASSSAFPSDGRPPRHTAFIIIHCGAVQKRGASLFPIIPYSRLASEKRGQRGTPALTVLPIRHIAAFPCIGEDSGEALPVCSVLVFVRKNIRAHIGKAGFSDKMPIHGLPFPNRRKRNAVSGPVISWPFPASKRASSNRMYPPSFSLPLREVRAAFKCHQAASPESKRFPDPMQPPRKDNTAPLSS